MDEAPSIPAWQRPISEQVTALRHDMGGMEQKIEFMKDEVEYLTKWKSELERSSVLTLPAVLFGYPDRKDDVGVIGAIRASLLNLEKSQDRLIDEQRRQNEEAIRQTVRMTTRANVILGSMVLTLVGVIGQIALQATHLLGR